MILLAWSDKLPSGWEAKPLRSIADYVVSNVDKVPSEDEVAVRLCNYTDVYNNEFITLRLGFMQATASAEEISKFGLSVGDVIITKDSESWDDIGVPSLVRETASDLVCGYHLALLRPLAEKMEGAFLLRCIQAKPIRVQLELAANGVTRFGIPKSEIGTLTLPVPPVLQQRAIADFLDRETAQVDALVGAKERVLGLLAEKRRAFITRAVTHGIDPRAPLRNSGIPWLGEIPGHWQLERAKYIFRQSALPVRHEDEMVTCFRDGQVTLRRNRRAEGFTNANLELGYQGIRAGQLVLHSMDAFAGAIGVSDSQGKCSPEYIICDPLQPDTDTHYYGLLLRTMALSGFIQASCAAVRERAPRIRFPDFGEMFLPMPPRREQLEIVDRIRGELDRLERLRAANGRTIALLKERRAALIAAAVTGQIAVPDAIA
ncbi:MAG: restriction endonuclease subunit S [Chloroflexota bacterium]